MGVLASCCKNPSQKAPNGNCQEFTEPPGPAIMKNRGPDIRSDLTFPRYPILPAIETKDKDPPSFTNSLTEDKHSDEPTSIQKMFNMYRDPNQPIISADGIERLCSDLDLSPEDFRVLVLAYCLGAAVMCQFTEDEFITGCSKLGITGVESMKDSLPKLLNSVRGPGFSPFYRWSYKFALDQESGQRTLPMDMAVRLWQLVFTENKPAVLDRWLDFIQNRPSLKGVPKDTWDMFLVFTEQINDNLKAYNDAEAWPSLLDDFVEHELDCETTRNGLTAEGS